ncbi:anhydro-N-acetylmuramic acid kinase [Pseudoalteromonas rubra]|uniref:Anhydro-N-acetylmuramic acid kinase n=1 Tax=Pseudoalteromonas rubra TaxID=43658 RepID=A0A5S3WUD5_9GAMM|nr:anhydro-N-acetylmuramic acid kinase [Pseudoalteromonas rubra]TMP31672.1 anhydro-N-acetylmuramic acid kinase [Pseudoalteromonas rubra]TMP33247.1 anhydro-N-acetylmuramic acid kinase [Pseudoalteromonas rubra]
MGIKQINQLGSIANKPSRIILGLMSGTSLDGLDLALCQVSGAGSQTRCKLLKFTTVPYDNEFKEKVRKVFAQDNVDFEYLTLLNPWIGSFHAKIINRTLAHWQLEPQDIDLIASHGQTVYHCPQHQHSHTDFGNGTLQLGDGDHVATQTQIITISDFRQKHIARGGEGAPLAQYGDYLLYQKSDLHRILLNLGGIANYTVLPAGGKIEDVQCTDLGPGNTLMDAYCQRYFNLPYDEAGALAAQGRVSNDLLELLKSVPFFHYATPKTTGPEVFSLAMLEDKITSLGSALSHYDVLATLNELTAWCVIEQINRLGLRGPTELLLSGGGAHNTLLITKLKSRLCEEFDVSKLSSDGVEADSKEAALFAVLANECVAGDGLFSFGKISLPG